jgi:hypothetical protein
MGIKNKAALLFMFECSLYGTDGRTEAIVRLISMREYKYKRTSVAEKVYRREGTRVVLVKETLAIEVDSDGSCDESAGNRTDVYLRVYSSPDMSKQRKTIVRTAGLSTVRDKDAAPLLEKYMEILGFKPELDRAYSKSVYRYRGCEVQLIKKGAGTLVVAKKYTESVAEGEEALEDVKERLSPWIDLIMPPREVWDMLC